MLSSGILYDICDNLFARLFLFEQKSLMASSTVMLAGLGVAVITCFWATSAFSIAPFAMIRTFSDASMGNHP
jgi:hypothetical protein